MDEISFMMDETSFVTDKTSFVTVKMSFVTDETAFVTDETTIVTDKTSFVMDESSFVKDESSFVTYETSFVTDEKSFVTVETSFVMDETSFIMDVSSQNLTLTLFFPDVIWNSWHFDSHWIIVYCQMSLVNFSKLTIFKETQVDNIPGFHKFLGMNQFGRLAITHFLGIVWVLSPRVGKTKELFWVTHTV